MSDKTEHTPKRNLRIGIISLYGWLKLWDNYGTLLQNFALQTYLQQRGHTTFWIRTRSTQVVQNKRERITSELIRHLRILVRFLLTPILGRPYSKRLATFNKRNPRHFEEFIRRHTPTTLQEFSMEELVDNPPVVDALIVGSDQVWRDVTKINFLGFGPREVRRIAYAVSAPWPVLDESWLQDASQFTPQLNAVSVREAEGLAVCKKLEIEDAVHVIDPVLLLKEEHYLSIIRNDGEDRNYRNSFILGYFVNIRAINQIPWQSIVGFANTGGYELKVVPMQGAELVIPEKHVFTPSPSAWLNAFHKADFVVTNSYHGALFAIIMKKPFIVFLQSGVKAPENCRFTSALEPLGLGDRILARDSWQKITASELALQMSRPIDWDRVDLALTKWRRSSTKFLGEALET